MEATERALNTAAHLKPEDAGTVAILRGLAATAEQLLRNGGITESGRFDNVTIPTYLRYADALGLTPAGRHALRISAPDGASGGRTLHSLRTLYRGATSARPLALASDDRRDGQAG